MLEIAPKASKAEPSSMMIIGDCAEGEQSRDCAEGEQSRAIFDDDNWRLRVAGVPSLLCYAYFTRFSEYEDFYIGFKYYDSTTNLVQRDQVTVTQGK